MRKKVIGIALCLALMCMLLPYAFADSYTVIFKPEGATGWSAKEDCGTLEVKSTGDNIIAVPANPKKEGYNFKGWSTVAGDASSVSIPSTDAEHNVSFEKCNVPNGGTLYAIWEGFNLDKSSITLYTSTTATINATDILPVGNTIVWSTEPETGIVTLTPSEDTYTCTVTPAAAGTATITATCGSATHTCKVTVTAESLNLSDSELALNTDTTKVGLITATTVPAEQKVEWSSSNKEAVKLIIGADTKTCTVSAVKAGKATITAKSGTKTATCEVTVTDSTIATAISLSPTKLSLTVDGDKTGTGKITATVTPSTSTEVIQWKSSDETVATVAPSNDTYQTSCIVTGKKAGNATVTAYIGDGTVKASCEVTVGTPSITFTLPTEKFTKTDSYTITATTSPETGGKVTWKSSDTSVMTVTNDTTDTTGRSAIIKPVKSGSVQITATYTTAGGVTVSRSKTTTVAITKQQYKVIYNANGCWYYDNPSSYQIKVNAPYTKTIKSISIYNTQQGTTYYPVIGTDVSKTYDVADTNQYTILTFTKAFMQTLPRYTYQTMTITFEDGTAATYLHILSSTSKPITGDVKFNPYWIVLALGATGMGAALTMRKKEDNF